MWTDSQVLEQLEHLQVVNGQVAVNRGRSIIDSFGLTRAARVHPDLEPSLYSASSIPSPGTTLLVWHNIDIQQIDRLTPPALAPQIRPSGDGTMAHAVFLQRSALLDAFTTFFTMSLSTQPCLAPLLGRLLGVPDLWARLPHCSRGSCWQGRTQNENIPVSHVQ